MEWEMLLGLFYFNSQPHEEADEEREKNVQTEVYFNSQPHEEADHSGN